MVLLCAASPAAWPRAGLLCISHIVPALSECFFFCMQACLHACLHDTCLRLGSNFDFRSSCDIVVRHGHPAKCGCKGSHYYKNLNETNELLNALSNGIVKAGVMYHRTNGMLFSQVEGQICRA